MSDEEELKRLADEVLFASRAFVGVAARSMAAAVDDDITPSQYRALVVLAGQAPLSLAALADQLDLQPPTATRLCDRLVRKGLIGRRRSPTDGRSVELTLSAHGAEVVATVLEARRVMLSEILAKLPPDRRQGVRDALVGFAEAAGEVRELALPDHWLL